VENKDLKNMKYLILGDGKLATELHRQTGWDYISRKKNGFDIRDKDLRMLDTDYAIYINCIANTNTTDNTKKAHWDVNYLSVINLANFCRDYNIKLVHISSDYLYSGSNSNASEEDVPVHVNNWYCYTKLLADGYIQALSKNYLIIRTSFKAKPYPWDVAWTDISTNADYIDVISDYIIRLIKLDATGVYNIGTETKSFYDLAIQTKPDCKPISDDHSFNRPHDVTMNLNKLKNKLGL